MIGQYLPDNNETATVAFRQNFCQLNSLSRGRRLCLGAAAARAGCGTKGLTTIRSKKKRSKWLLGSTWWAREPLLPAEGEIDGFGTVLARCAYVYPDLMSKLV
jgi:hypothetical protein